MEESREVLGGSKAKGGDAEILAAETPSLEEAKAEATKRRERMEKEDKEFLENVPVARTINQEHVKEHLGHHSDRRGAKGHYSNDAEGRFTYKGTPPRCES